MHQALFHERLTKRFTVRFDMAIPIRNHVLEVIKQKENYTDKELEKALTKDGTIITEGKFNKVSARFRDNGIDQCSMGNKR